MKKIFAICGSTKASSTNLLYIAAITKLLGTGYEVVTLSSIADLPHFTPDLDTDDAPQSVLQLRKNINLADGILICTPEYAMGLPGSLKNVLDWTVSSASFSKKPVLAIVASSQGEKAYQSLIDVLTVIEAKVFPLLVPFAKAKITPEASITDLATLSAIEATLKQFVASLSNE
ncbi:NADPH-dependent FMN reductase [Pedobacter soli]|uniref:NAD(P)H-dependent FMN reductase n=1 Tax=Pedobacter soli TaxID=390242 RepID=A0A1G6LEJ3_9SPHI|nr:NADPH-dependent FMN reductase [Pedobacter soli]SDC41659.1 NAD(P)H-dependent FMN reductase [Pedobacter soli]